MGLKNIRVREKDIKSGKIIYVAHPFFGIEKFTVISKPYPIWSFMGHLIGMFFKVNSKYGAEYKSISDCGISSLTYNHRRTFFKLKQAEAYAEVASKDVKVIERHSDHVGFCRRDQELREAYE